DLLDEVRRNLLLERTVDVAGRDRIGRQQLSGLVAAEGVPRVAIGLHRERNLPRLLQRDERVREVVARFAVDLAGRESLAIEQNLKREVVAARQRRRLGLFLLLNGLVCLRMAALKGPPHINEWPHIRSRWRGRSPEGLRYTKQADTDERKLNSIRSKE